MIDGKSFSNQPTKTNLISKTTIGQEDDCTTGCLLHCIYFKNYLKNNRLSEQQALDVDRKATQQINFNENLEQNRNATMFFIIKKAKQTKLDFSNRVVISFWKTITTFFKQHVSITL